LHSQAWHSSDFPVVGRAIAEIAAILRSHPSHSNPPTHHTQRPPTHPPTHHNAHPPSYVIYINFGPGRMAQKDGSWPKRLR